MDPMALQASSSINIFWRRKFLILETASSARSAKSSDLSVFCYRLFNERDNFLFARATGKNRRNEHISSSGNDNHFGKEENSKSNDALSPNFHNSNLDWREFRANLIAQEQAEIEGDDQHNQNKTLRKAGLLSGKWAHPISMPETGCVLVATQKLDGVGSFEKTVILLLRLGGALDLEGTIGLVMNHPLKKKIKHVRLCDNELAATFADCSLHFGGPLESNMFLLSTSRKTELRGFDKVMPGLFFGSKNKFDAAAALVKKGMASPQDFRFFVGYSGWQMDQLRQEIKSNFWHVAACSSNLLCVSSSSSSSFSDSSPVNLWQEILLLMGGGFAQFKPMQDV